MSSTSHRRLTKNIVVYENERCWLGHGFSRKGLLPNDRGCYSTADGSISWKSLEEAQKSLLTRGWIVPENSPGWQPDGAGDEWWYARDFSTVKTAKAFTRGPLHWVRFRLLKLHVVFDPYTASSCDHCDSKVVRELASLLFQLLAYSVAPRKSSSSPTAAAVLSMKRDLLDALLVAEEQSTTNEDAFFQLDSLRRTLIDTVERRAKHQQFLPLAKATPFAERSKIHNFEQVCETILQDEFFPVSEQELIAGITIRKIDQHYQLHCKNKKECDQNGCRFGWVGCPNVGCQEQLSRIHVDEHVATCPYAPEQCQACGEENIMRSKLSIHLQEVCPLREAVCPFQRVGCISIVSAQEMAQHVVSETSSHLLMAVNRMMEYENEIRTLRQRVDVLERDNTSLAKMLSAQQASVNDLGNKKFAGLQREVNAIKNKSKKDAKRIDELEREAKNAKQN